MYCFDYGHWLKGFGRCCCYQLAHLIFNSSCFLWGRLLTVTSYWFDPSVLFIEVLHCAIINRLGKYQWTMRIAPDYMMIIVYWTPRNQSTTFANSIVNRWCTKLQIDAFLFIHFQHSSFVFFLVFKSRVREYFRKQKVFRSICLIGLSKGISLCSGSFNQALLAYHTVVFY